MSKSTPLIKPEPPYGEVHKKSEQPVVIHVLPLLGKWLLIVFGVMGTITIAATAYLEYFQ